MPRLAKKSELKQRKRAAPEAYDDEAGVSERSSDDDDALKNLSPDEIRALKRFKANLDDDPSDDDEDDVSEEPEEPDGGGRRAAPQRRAQHKQMAREEGTDEDEGEGDEGAEDDSEDEEGSSDGDDDERTLEDQVADVPFEVLESLKGDGRGLVGPAARAAAARAAARSFKRDNKDRPQEMSSKRPVGRFREVIQVPHRDTRDPRFDATSGPPATDTFRRRYSFVFNDMLPAEKKELQAKIKKEKNPKMKAKMQAQLQRLDTALREEDLRRRTQKLEAEWKSKERNAVAAGKTPYFLKDSDKKRLALLAKYQELKEHGKLDKFMEKRRKKNAAKDHRYLPSGRRQPEA